MMFGRSGGLQIHLESRAPYPSNLSIVKSVCAEAGSLYILAGQKCNLELGRRIQEFVAERVFGAGFRQAFEHRLSSTTTCELAS